MDFGSPRRFYRQGVLTTLLTVCAPFASTTAWAGGPTISYNIPAGDASKTLQVYLQQTRIEMLYRTDNVRGRHTNAVNGTFEASEALQRMLAGTDLEYNFTPDFTFAAVKTREEEQPGTAEPPRVDVAKASLQTETLDQPNRLKDVFGDTPIDEVVVTGTLIRGVQDMTSPLEFITKRQLNKTAYPTVQDALQALPVNMGSTFSEAFGGTGNFARGTAANLRGLGAGATLVLINGRRQPYSGVQADFVDLSNIPWSAVERIEVLPDGASALYGSDAIAGVVNVIMRQDFSGAETQARYGMTQDGGADQKLISQMFGASWEGGKALFSYQYSARSVLESSARTYTASEDKRAFGGTDRRSVWSNPGNILNPSTFLPAYAIPADQSGTSLTAADLLSGTTNLQNRLAGVDILPDRKAHSVYLSASQKLGERFELFGDARLNKSDIYQRGGALEQVLFVPATNPFAAKVNPYAGTPYVLVGYNFSDDVGVLNQFADVRSYVGSFGVKARAGETWRLSLSGTQGSETLKYATNNSINGPALSAALADPNPATAFNPFADGSRTNPATLDKIRMGARELSRSQISSANFVADGTLTKWAMGPVRLAVGTEWREEMLERSSVRTTKSYPRADFGRTVRSAFAELSVPLVGDPNDGRAVPRLELSLAGRYEHYSDFGSTANPKIGLRWVPFDSLKLRSSWGTSFRAPKLTDIYDSTHDSSGFARIPDPRSSTGSSIILVEEGSNPNLDQETAQTWTAGVDFAPPSTPGLEVSLTYYSVNYNDRIVVPGTTPPNAILLQEDRWASVINRRPTANQIAAVCESASYSGGTAAQCESTPVAALIDLRVRNLASTRVRGLDLKIDYSFRAEHLGAFDLGLNSGYVLSFLQEASNSSPMNSVLDTVGNPLALRVRATADWSQHGFNGAGFGANLTVDHFGGYNAQTLSQSSISPLTTIDLRTSYRTSLGNGPLDDLEFGLNGSNIFNRAPPFVDQSIGYDMINAQPYGRVISFSVQKRW